MDAARYFLPRPPLELTAAKCAAFDELRRATVPGGVVDYRLPYPRWQYLSYICETHDLVLHGSPHADIDRVEPRQAVDKREFAMQRAIYATTDGIWAIFFAIMDRIRFPAMTLFNSCLSVRAADGSLSEPVYFFSVSQAARVQEPWCGGMVYILPRAAFEQEPAATMQGMQIVFPHWIGRQPVRPVARLRVEPHDFPFVEQVHGHSDRKLAELYAADPGAFPIGALEDG